MKKKQKEKVGSKRKARPATLKPKARKPDQVEVLRERVRKLEAALDKKMSDAKRRKGAKQLADAREALAKVEAVAAPTPLPDPLAPPAPVYRNPNIAMGKEGEPEPVTVYQYPAGTVQVAPGIAVPGFVPGTTIPAVGPGPYPTTTNPNVPAGSRVEVVPGTTVPAGSVAAGLVPGMYPSQVPDAVPPVTKVPVEPKRPIE